MQRGVTKITVDFFKRLDEFLGQVQGDTQKLYRFQLFLTNRVDILIATLELLGFTVVESDWNSLIVQYTDSTRPPVRFAVSTKASQHINDSKNWTIVAQLEDTLLVTWNRPEAPAFLRATEARKIADKAKELNVVLQKVYEAAEAGHYSITVDKCSDTAQKHLSTLGYKLKIPENLIGLFISWE